MPHLSDQVLPYRGEFGAQRPGPLADLPLPPDPMPSRHRTRPLKAWRYIGVFGTDFMLCLGQVRVGRARQTFWAVWDRKHERLYERTVIGRGRLTLGPGFARLSEDELHLE